MTRPEKGILQGVLYRKEGLIQGEEPELHPLTLLGRVQLRPVPHAVKGGLKGGLRRVSYYGPGQYHIDALNKFIFAGVYDFMNPSKKIIFLFLFFVLQVDLLRGFPIVLRCQYSKGNLNPF